MVYQYLVTVWYYRLSNTVAFVNTEYSNTVNIEYSVNIINDMQIIESNGNT
jgi:hypothetical protein